MRFWQQTSGQEGSASASTNASRGCAGRVRPAGAGETRIHGTAPGKGGPQNRGTRRGISRHRDPKACRRGGRLEQCPFDETGCCRSL